MKVFLGLRLKATKAMQQRVLEKPERCHSCEVNSFLYAPKIGRGHCCMYYRIIMFHTIIPHHPDSGKGFIDFLLTYLPLNYGGKPVLPQSSIFSQQYLPEMIEWIQPSFLGSRIQDLKAKRNIPLTFWKKSTAHLHSPPF